MTAKERLLERVMSLSEVEAVETLRFLGAAGEEAVTRPSGEVLRRLGRLFADSPAEDSTSAIRAARDAR